MHETITIPETTKFLLICGYYERGASDTSVNVNGQIIGVVRNVGESITIPQAVDAAGSKTYDVWTTLTWVNSTTFTIERENTLCKLQVYACE